jgi:glycosyltransferase involved in cell wall biosynthesis
MDNKIKIVFLSNFLNHHQLPICNEFMKQVDGSFRFIATTPVPEERLRMGYSDYNDSHSFVVKAFDGENDEISRLISDADIVISAGAPSLSSLVKRIRSDKLTFVYAERLLKDGDQLLKNPLRLLKYKWLFSRFRFNNLHLLCASSYAAIDFYKLGAFPDKKYKWGYFPELPSVNHETFECSPRSSHSHDLNLLWAGRLLDWKRPFDVLELALKLKASEIPFRLNIIGDGPEAVRLKQAIHDWQLSDQVKMLGSKTPVEVRNFMTMSDVFLFTSDYHEGWGAVLNEAMGCGSAVVASHACGSTSYLIQHGVNGLVFPCGDTDSIFNYVNLLAANESLRFRLGKNAQQTVSGEWSASSAVVRFLELCECIQNGRPTPFESGPCSIAKEISNEEAEAEARLYADRVDMIQ